MRSGKIKASALHFSVLVATIVALLLTSFLLLSKTQYFFRAQSNNFVDQVNATGAGLSNYLQEAPGESTSVVSTYQDAEITIEKSYWGGFDLYASKSENPSFTKHALAGASFGSPSQSLILQDNFTPLVLAGDAYLEGTALLPESGVSTGAINGQYYSRDRLVHGPTRNVNSIEFPKLSPSWKAYLQDMTNFIPSSTDQTATDASSLKNSFNNALVYYYSENPIYFDGQALGKVVVKSEKQIIITQNAQISDAVFIAPYIKIDPLFKGQLHIMATDSIILSSKSTLSYPSSLSLLDESEESTGFIRLEKDSEFAGNIIYTATKTTEVIQSNIILQEDSEVKGAIFCQGAIELEGSLSGTAITYFTMTSANGRRYKNHLFNGLITTSDLPEITAGLPLLGALKNVAHWLY